MQLVEREHFLANLQAILEDVTEGNGRFVLVSGEAGIGKTSLLEQFTETNEKPARVFWGTCDALFTPRPLGPLYDIAPQTQTNLLSLLEEQAPRASILAAVVDELENGPTPSILVIEDVHWADEATLDLLKFLGRRINRIKSMIVATYRDDEVAADHPLRFVLGDLPNRSVTRLRLPPLSEAGVDMLADRLGRRVKDLFLVTGGNPFFVTEALATKEAGVPVTVRDAVMSRATRLSSPARAVLELVSVVPAKTEMWLLNDTVNPDSSTLEECVAAGMLKIDADVIAFRHELARLAIEESLPMPRHHKLHARVLTALIDRNTDSLLPQLVHHATQANNGPAVLKYAPVAARQAAALSAHRESASHYKTALQYTNTIPLQDHAALLECRSFECYLTDQNQDALEARAEALKIWRQLGNHRREGDNLRWMSRINWMLGQKKEAEAYSVEAVKVLEKLAPGPELAMAYSNRSQLHMLADENDQAIVWGSRAIELAQSLNDTEILLHALCNVGTAEFIRDPEKGRMKLEESLRLALANDYQEHASRAYTNLAHCTMRVRNYKLAMHYFNEGIAYTKEHDIEWFQAYMTAKRAHAHFDLGDLDKAADDAAFVLGRPRAAATSKIPALAALGQVRVRRGDPDSSRLLDEAYELALQTAESQRLIQVAEALSEHAWYRGDVEQIMTLARSVLQMPRALDDPWVIGQFTFWIWRASGVVERNQGIAQPYALHMSGDWRSAANAWKEIGCPYEQAVALADGDEAARREALEIFERLGAGPAAERLRQTLRATGARGIRRGPRQSTKENPSGLTNRQLEVLALMADGLANSDIGDRLFISAKTVDHHVSAILSKLDAKTRGEAVAMASQAGLIKQTHKAKN